MDALRQDIGMSVSAPSIQDIIPVISPHFALHECSMDALRKDVGMLVPTSSLEIVPVIDLVPEQIMTKVKTSIRKLTTSFEHKGP